MSDVALDMGSGGMVRIRGAIDFDTVPKLLRAAAGMFDRPDPKIIVDFSAIELTKSVGLALMVEWQRRARGVNKEIAFINVPAQLMAMAKASGLETLLKIEAVNPAAP